MGTVVSLAQNGDLAATLLVLVGFSCAIGGLVVAFICQFLLDSIPWWERRSFATLVRILFAHGFPREEMPAVQRVRWGILAHWFGLAVLGYVYLARG